MVYTHHRDHDPTERMFERLSQNPDVERGLQRLENNPNEDPTLREMARTMLREVEEGRERVEQRQIFNVIGCIVFVIVLIIGGIILAAAGTKNRHY